jgi:hypothetical protein
MAYPGRRCTLRSVGNSFNAARRTVGGSNLPLRLWIAIRYCSNVLKKHAQVYMDSLDIIFGQHASPESATPCLSRAEKAMRQLWEARPTMPRAELAAAILLFQLKWRPGCEQIKDVHIEEMSRRMRHHPNWRPLFVVNGHAIAPPAAYQLGLELSQLYDLAP